MLKLQHCVLAVALIAPTCQMFAGESPSEKVDLVGQPAGLSAEPAKLSLNGARSHHQLLITSSYKGGELRDLTRAVTYKSLDASIAEVSELGIVRPKKDGTTKISVRIASLEALVEVTVSNMTGPNKVEFVNHVVAVLSKTGCNMGACHGSPSGKNGFRLSLRGYDPALDLESLTRDIYGRRTNRNNPTESLMLLKPVGDAPHEGGVRLEPDSLYYNTLKDWIHEGSQGNPENTPTLSKIELLPNKRVLNAPATNQQLVVLGHFSDGSVRDVTPLSVFSSSNEEVAKVSATGLIESTKTGETAVLVRYLDQLKTASLTFLKKSPDFVWSDPPENNYIDKYAFDKMQLLEILPSDLASDTDFLRRSSSDIRGTLPSKEEVQSFVTNKNPAKRKVWIDKLLESEEFLDFWTLKLADVLRSNRKVIQEKGIYSYQRWIRASLAEDKPFDEFVRELLTARGNTFSNPAANYYRVSRDPQNSVETTAQLFFGVRMQCAKCHNHPFERWTQDDYYGLAAFFARVRYKPGSQPGDEVVYVDRKGEVTQPRTGQVMKPAFLGGGTAEIPAGADRRVVLAQWLTGADNSFFGRAAVNRVWYHIMGRGIIDPPDDIRDSNPPSNEDLLAALSSDFESNSYSLKHLIRTILNSRVYQLSAETNKWNKDDEAYFSHAITKMLTAEQLLDAISVATNVPEKFAGLPAGSRATMLPDANIKNEFLQTFGKPNRELACECERESDSSLSQALQMINGPLLAGKLRNKSNRLGQLIAAKKTDVEIATELYLVTLGRFPNKAEIAAIVEHIKGTEDRRKALEDVHWALMNSKEFLFRH